MVSKEKIIKFKNSIHLPYWLLGLLVVIFILRIPSFFEPFSYGDELIYLTLGHGVRQGVPLYSGLHDNKPPLLYLLAALAGNVFWFKAILAAWSIATILVFWKLVRVLFPKNNPLHIVSTIIFALATTLPRLEGNIANAELFMIAPTMLAFIILLSKKLTPKWLLLAGILFSFAALFKIPAAFEVPVIVVFWLFTQKLNKNNIKNVAINTFYIGIGFLIPIIITFIWYGLHGAFYEYLVAAFLQNVGYLSSWRPSDTQLPFLVKNGPLLTRGLVILMGLILLLWKRKKLSKPFIFTTIWLLFALFGVTLSERPYPHYLIQAIPAVSILFGILTTDKTILQVVSIIPLSLAFLVPTYYNFWYYPTISYYTKFVEFATGKMSKPEYFNTFNGNLNRDYKISQFVTGVTSVGDGVFVWGDGVPIYAMSRRLPPIKYVADYHIKDFSTKEEVLNALVLNPPELIVILPRSDDFDSLNHFINDNYILLTKIDTAEIWKLLN